VITLVELSGDGTRPLGDGRTIIDGNALPGYTTLEGPKLYKRGGWYYVFAPAGGVKQGWQSAFRSRTIDGPYDGRIVLAQGTTDVNGPHQGALVDTPNGDSWFLHFQDREAYGRVVHLEPVVWRDGWPVIGHDSDRDGTGEPVRGFRTPIVSSAASVTTPQTSDEFDKRTPGLQWQWQANPDHAWIAPGARGGTLRLASRALPSINLWSAPNLLLQKLPASAFVATAAMTFAPAAGNERAGLIVFGTDYAWIGLRRSTGEQQVVTATATSAADGAAEREVAAAPFRGGTIYLRATVRPGAVVDFSYSADNRSFVPLGASFTAKPGRWVGAKIGLFAASPPGTGHPGFAEFDWFHINQVFSAQRPAPSP
jgi:beta-xylosidase